MKTLFSIAFFAAQVVVFAGCAPGEKFLGADTASIEFLAGDTAPRSVTVSSSSSWTIYTADLPKWLTIGYDADNTNVFTVTATRNESLDGRRAVIPIVSGDGLSVDIPLTQGSTDAVFDVSPMEIAPFGPREEEARALTVATNVTWEAVVLHGAGWIRYRTTAGTTPGTDLLLVNVTPIRSLDPRRDTIVLRPVVGAFSSLADSVAVVQTGLDLMVTSDAMNETTLETAIPADGGSVVMMVYSRAEWSVATGAPSDRVTIDSTSGPADPEYGTPIELTAISNPSTDEYTFTLTFTSGGETYEYLCRQPGSPTAP
jgi:hypothetical protein